jgi:hypothetical protein
MTEYLSDRVVIPCKCDKVNFVRFHTTRCVAHGCPMLTLSISCSDSIAKYIPTWTWFGNNYYIRIMERREVKLGRLSSQLAKSSNAQVTVTGTKRDTWLVTVT